MNKLMHTDEEMQAQFEILRILFRIAIETKESEEMQLSFEKRGIFSHEMFETLNKLPRSLSDCFFDQYKNVFAHLEEIKQDEFFSKMVLCCFFTPDNGATIMQTMRDIIEDVRVIRQNTSASGSH